MQLVFRANELIDQHVKHRPEFGAAKQAQQQILERAECMHASQRC